MHQDKETINKRFFEALDLLKETGKISSMAEFCRASCFDPGNLSRLRKQPTRELPLPLLAYLTDRYNVSPRYVLTGRGGVFGAF